MSRRVYDDDDRHQHHHLRTFGIETTKREQFSSCSNSDCPSGRRRCNHDRHHHHHRHLPRHRCHIAIAIGSQQQQQQQACMLHHNENNRQWCDHGPSFNRGHEDERWLHHGMRPPHSEDCDDRDANGVGGNDFNDDDDQTFQK